MSEFSRSVHLFGATVDRGVEQMRSIGIPGAVVGATPLSATLLMDEQHLPHFIAASPHPLLYYVYEADYGIWIHFYQGGEHVASVTFDYDEEEGEEAPLMNGEEETEDEPSGIGIPYTFITPNIGEILARHGFLSPDQSRRAEEVFNAFARAWQENEWEGVQECIGQTGEVLGLYAFRWLNEEDALSTPEELLERYPEAIIVER